MQKGNFDDAVGLFSDTEITDENEMMLRIMRGNLFFASGDKWKGVCEYEIAYNISLKTGDKFPHLPAIRCGDWFLKETDNLQKARRFFHHCCKTCPTFHPWMGLGIVCFLELNFFDAEKYFGEANKIYKKSCDNWIYLALTNFKLQRYEMFEQCFLIARKFPVENSLLMDEAEMLLDF
jgi:tetratricopeptide (TPR) repeat protein